MKNSLEAYILTFTIWHLPSTIIVTMKYRHNIATAALTAAMAATVVACSDSYPGLEYTGNNIPLTTDESYDKTPIMAFINKQNFFSVTATRSGDSNHGTGPFTGVNNAKYENSVFYVFAFKGQSDTETGDPDLSRSHYAIANANGGDDDSQYCLVDGKDYGFGYPAMLTADYPGAFDFKNKPENSFIEEIVKDGDKPSSAQLYYSSRWQDVGYNFFAYHIDNLYYPLQYVRNKDRITYDMTIDGTQDIMCGVAPRLTAAVLADQQDVQKSMTADERDIILNNGLYSTFAAHRGVNPVIDLKHQLTQLNFAAYPGDKESENIVLEGIVVHERTHGTLTVASKNPHDPGRADYAPIVYEPYGEKDSIYLAGNPGNGEKCPDFEPVTIPWKEEFERMKTFERDSIHVGGSMMVPESDEYLITLKFRQNKKKEDGTDDKTIYGMKADYKVSLPSGSLFQKGHSYTISIVVYGLEPIKVTANIEGWKEEKEDVEVVPDDVYIHD